MAKAKETGMTKAQEKALVQDNETLKREIERLKDHATERDETIRQLNDECFLRDGRIENEKAATVKVQAQLDEARRAFGIKAIADIVG